MQSVEVLRCQDLCLKQSVSLRDSSDMVFAYGILPSCRTVSLNQFRKGQERSRGLEKERGISRVPGTQPETESEVFGNTCLGQLRCRCSKNSRGGLYPINFLASILFPSLSKKIIAGGPKTPNFLLNCFSSCVFDVTSAWIST